MPLRLPTIPHIPSQVFFESVLCRKQRWSLFTFTCEFINQVFGEQDPSACLVFERREQALLGIVRYSLPVNAENFRGSVLE